MAIDDWVSVSFKSGICAGLTFVYQFMAEDTDKYCFREISGRLIFRKKENIKSIEVLNTAVEELFKNKMLGEDSFWDVDSHK